jgi:CheY-like chemotaxis protein
MRVLIADDDRVHVRMVSRFLNQRGIDTTPVFDGMQTLMFARRTSPDLIILDINMPGGNGFEVLKKLRSSNITGLIPVLVLSGSIDAEVEKLVKAAGADAFLRKSVDNEELYRVLYGLAGMPCQPAPTPLPSAGTYSFGVQ